MKDGKIKVERSKHLRDAKSFIATCKFVERV